MNIEELSNQDSREIEEADFSAFSLQDADTEETLEFYRHGEGYATLSGVSGRDDDDGFSFGSQDGYSFDR